MLFHPYAYRAAVSETVFYGVRPVLFRKGYQVDRIGGGEGAEMRRGADEGGGNRAGGCAGGGRAGHASSIR